MIISFLAFSRSSFGVEKRISGLIFKALQILIRVYRFGIFRPDSIQFTWFWESPIGVKKDRFNRKKRVKQNGIF